jgi:hypothetical protein
MLVVLQSNPVPASAYMLCYFPLAFIVLGLVAYFVITDRHASRPYLRFNPFVAANASQEELEARPPEVGETPAGPLGAAPAGTTTVFRGEHGERIPVDKDAVQPPAPERTPPLEGEKGPQRNPDLGILPPGAQDALNTDAPGDVKPRSIKPDDKDRK